MANTIQKLFGKTASRIRRIFQELSLELLQMAKWCAATQRRGYSWIGYWEPRNL